jgi:hypothetical protein
MLQLKFRLWLPQVVSSCLLTPEARVRSQGGPCEIYGQQSATGTGFSASTSASFVSIIPPMLHCHLHLHIAFMRTNVPILGTFQKPVLFRKSGSFGQKSGFAFFFKLWLMQMTVWPFSHKWCTKAVMFADWRLDTETGWLAARPTSSQLWRHSTMLWHVLSWVTASPLEQGWEKFRDGVTTRLGGSSVMRCDIHSVCSVSRWRSVAVDAEVNNNHTHSACKTSQYVNW